MVKSVTPLHQKLPGKNHPLLMAHRGKRALFPENTLAAFRQAVEDGAEINETGLHLIADEKYFSEYEVHK